MDRNLPEGCRLHSLPVKGDERGSLIALERSTGVPFEVARVYFIYETQPGVSRGFHAHRNLRQFAVCVAGSCTMVVDDGEQRASLRLDRPDVALEIGPMIWREMHDFSADCVVMVLADRCYDECDYIRDYGEFAELVRVG